MLGQLMRLLLTGTCLVILAEAAFATTVTIHTDDARATLLAMQNPSLTGEDAATIAKMHGNQGVLRKLREWKIPASTETFANALIVDYPEVLCAWELNWRVIAYALADNSCLTSQEHTLPSIQAAWRPLVCARRIRSPFAVRSSFVCLISIMRRTQCSTA
jgi:hypothetical protein